MNLRPGMIELSKVDLGAMRPDYGYPMCADDSSSSKLPKKKVYPSLYIDGVSEPIDLPDTGSGKIKFRILRRDSRMKESGDKVHGATIEIQSIETDDDEVKEKKGGAKTVALSALRPAMIALDSRPRNGDGQFEPQTEGAVDPNAMAAAYGGVAAEKIQRRKNLLGRIRGMLGKAPAADTLSS